MNLKKLRKLGYLASKTQLGTINTFFYLLECRIDNILLRFNLGSRFFVRNFIQAGNVLLNNKLIFLISLNSFDYKIKLIVLNIIFVFQIIYVFLELIFY